MASLYTGSMIVCRPGQAGGDFPPDARTPPAHGTLCHRPASSRPGHEVFCMPAPVVIVHDDANVLHPLAQALEVAGHAVARFDDVRTAWDALGMAVLAAGFAPAA